MLLIHVVGTQLLFVLVACNFGIAIAIGRRPVMVGAIMKEIGGGHAELGSSAAAPWWWRRQTTKEREEGRGAGGRREGGPAPGAGGGRKGLGPAGGGGNPSGSGLRR